MSFLRLVIAVVAGSLAGLAQTCHDIRTVDFRNATVHSAPFDENELTGPFSNSRQQFDFQFKAGVADLYINGHAYTDGTPEARAKIVADSVVEVPSGPTVRFLQMVWEHLKGTGSFAAILGFTCSNGNLQQVFQFSSDGASFEVGPGDQIVIQQEIWTEKDAHCCPSQRRKIYYGWDDLQQIFRRLRVDGPGPISLFP